MTRIHYPNAKSRMIFVTLIPAGFVAFGVFGAGIYLWWSFDYEWAAFVFGFLAVILGGGLQLLLFHRFLAALPCPRCGRMNLTLQEGDGSRQLLVCESCHVEWDTGICNDSLPT